MFSKKDDVKFLDYQVGSISFSPNFSYASSFASSISSGNNGSYGNVEVHAYAAAGESQLSPKDRLTKTWFNENQYFSGEAGLRVGTYVDFTPFRKVFGLRIGEYRESSYSTDYYNNKSHVSHSENHFFEIAASYGIGASIKYNIGKNRFESGSLSLFGFSFEYSVQSSYQSQIYFGLDTGTSIGLGLGAFTNVKGGWRFNL